MNQFLLGANVMACAAIGLFFLRFYWKTRDGLLAIFAVAFWVLGANWLALGIMAAYQVGTDEVRTWLYVFRLAAFLLIIVGILQKNLKNRP